MKIGGCYAGQVIEAGAHDTQCFRADPAAPAQGGAPQVNRLVALQSTAEVIRIDLGAPANFVQVVIGPLAELQAN